MKITFTIELGNEAMNCPDHVAQALQAWIRRYSGEGAGGQFGFTASEIRDTSHGVPIKDANGNLVGGWQVME